MAGHVEKICVKCGTDVSAIERSKDAKGRYWCMPCYRAALAKQEAKREAERRAQHAAAPAGDADDQMMAALLDEGVHETAQPTACPNCRAMMPPGSVLCMSCGYNAQTGETLSTVARNRSKAEKAMDRVGDAGKKVEAPMLVLLSVIGGSIGGVIGAGIWAAVAYNLRLEIGWLAIGVGLITGGGVAVCAKDYTGMLTGLIAVVIAIGAIVGGKYWASSIIVSDYIEQVSSTESTDVSDGMSWMATLVADEWEAAGRRLDWPEDMDNSIAWERLDFPRDVWAEARDRWMAMGPQEQIDFVQEQRQFGEDDALGALATEVADDWEASGQELDWPEGMSNEWAWAEEEFPEDVWAEAERRWYAMTPLEQEAYVADQQGFYEGEFTQAFQEAATSEFFLGTFGILDFAFFAFAIMAAYGVGSGGDLNG